MNTNTTLTFSQNRIGLVRVRERDRLLPFPATFFRSVERGQRWKVRLRAPAGEKLGLSVLLPANGVSSVRLLLFLLSSCTSGCPRTLIWRENKNVFISQERRRTLEWNHRVKAQKGIPGPHTACCGAIFSSPICIRFHPKTSFIKCWQKSNDFSYFQHSLICVFLISKKHNNHQRSHSTDVVIQVH